MKRILFFTIMINKYIMTLGKFAIGVFSIFLALSSCNSNDDDIIGDHGYQLSYRNVPPETLQAFENDYPINDNNIQCPDLHVSILSSLKELAGYNQLQYYYLSGDKSVENQISDFLDPNGVNFNGSMPIPVCYTVEECKSIKICLYDKSDNFIADITDGAQFSYVYDSNDPSEVGCNILINAERQFVGKIVYGTTIQEYLSFHPMVFAEAHFIFPDLNKDIFNEEIHATIEIELTNGVKLTTKSIKR